MKKFTKRALSLLLSILMITTMLPTFAISAFADEIESIVWKYDAAQASQAGSVTPINTQTNLNDSKSVSGKTSTVTVVPNGSGSYNDTTKVITHIENGYAYGTINDVPADCKHWKLTFRFAYTGNQNDANVPVFAVGRASNSVLIKVMSNGDYYISGTKIGTIANPSALNCASVDDVRTASFEYNNGTLSFNIAGNVQFTESNPTYVINATSHFVGGLKYFATGEDANKISGMNLSKIIAAASAEDSASVQTKNGTLNQNGYQILCNGTEGRWADNQWNIVNDRQDNNTSAGVVRIPLADVKNMQVNSATFKMTVDTASGDSETNGLDVYWSTDYAKINGYIAGGQTNSVGCSSGAGTTANDSFATKLGFSRTGSLVATYPKSTTGERSFDVQSVLQTIIDTNADYLYLIVMQKNAGGNGSTSGWSDTKIKPTSLSITYNVQNKVMAKSEVQSKLDNYSYSGISSQKGTWYENKNNSVVNIPDSLNSSNQGEQKTYQNILWAGTSNFDCGKDESKKSSKNVVAFLRYQPVVMLYDGKTSPRAPIMTVCGTSSKSDRWLLGIAMTDNDGNSLGLVHNWLGSRDSSYGANWDYTNAYNRNGGTDMKVSQTYGTKSSENYRVGTSGLFGWATNPGYSNIYQYNGTMNDTTYLKTITPTVTAYVSGSDDNNWNDIVMPMTSNTPVYVVNYKAIIDKVASVKTDLNSFDPSIYTVASVQAYYDSIIALVSYDISSAGGKISSSNVAGGAQTVANELKALVDNYNTAKAGLQKINTVTFSYHSGKTLTKKVLDGHTCTVPDDDSPAKFEKNNADTHKVTRYYWGPADAKITADVTYNEKTNIAYESHAWVKTTTTVAPTCEDDGYTVYECSICGETSHQDLVDPNGHTYRPNQGSAVAPSNYTNGETFDAEKDYKHAINCIISSSHTKKEESCDFGASWTSIDADTEKSTCSTCGGYVTRAIIHGYDIVFKKVDGTVIATNPTIEGEYPSTPNLLNYSFIDEAGHHSFSWNKEIVAATEATEYQMVENELVPHAYADNYTEITAATCYAEGLEADPCTVDRTCKYSKTRPIAKKAHTFGAWAYDEDQQKQYHTCTVEECKYTEYDECSFAVTEDVAATCTVGGHTTYTCSECGGGYTEYSLPLGHDLAANWTSQGNGKHAKACSRCDYVETQDCIFTPTVLDPTCTEPAYSTSICSVCSYTTEKVALNVLTEKRDIDGKDDGYIRVTGGSSGSTTEGTKEVNLGYKVSKMEVTIETKTYDGTVAWQKDGWVKVTDENGNQKMYREAAGTQTDTFTLENTGYFKIDYMLYGSSSETYFDVKSIKIIDPKYDPKGHNYVKDNNFGNGLLGTHTCSRCHETTEHNLDLQRVNSTIVASCKDCDFSEVLHTTANTVTVTENNLFDTDKFFRSYTADATNTTSHGKACFRRTDGKAVVIGNGDNYTSHDRENDYLIPVEGGKTYQFDFDASTTYGDVMLFFRGAGLGYDSNYLSMRKSGTAIGTNTIEFTVPEGADKQLYIRIGTNNSGDRNAYCVFSNFALHEKDDPNYRMIKDVASGSAINDILDPINQHGTADFCSYVFKNSSISFADGTMANGKTVDRNVNVVAQKEHTLYKEFRNGTVAHYYCIDCGYNTDKIVSAPSLIYHESFDDATINGSTLTSSNGNATLHNAGTATILDGYGVVDGNGNSADYRKNVLKVNANNAAQNGNYIKFDTNPVSNNEDVKTQGLTLSFWRTYESAVGEAEWPEIIRFAKDDSYNNNRGIYYYFETCGNGISSFNQNDGAGTAGNYYDFIPTYQDPTTHAAGNDKANWMNVVVTIDPDKGVTVYTNGEPHPVLRVQAGGKYSDGVNDAELAQDILNYITENDTEFRLFDGDPYNQTNKNTYVDDIRMYSGAMTQVEINNMYVADDTDYNRERASLGLDAVKNSAGHDPTAVTVYTLPGGKTVGQEYIDYHNIDVTNKSQVVDIDYYIFGTGMTIYHSDDNVNWEVVGDQYGRCGYQNQQLYGGEYTVAIKEQLDFARHENAGHGTAWQEPSAGAGYLQWAPHIMYNINADCWQYYGSTSSWGAMDSCIFTGNSQNICGPYENIKTVFVSCQKTKDSSTPGNAIDSCVYYGHDENGRINPNEMYMLYGSWQPTYVIELDPTTGQNKYYNPADPYGKNYGTGYTDEANGYHYYGKVICAANPESEGGGSGEGGFMIYQDGYYYFYISLGSNGGNYQLRCFRSQYPDRGFVAYNGEEATSTTATHHGMSFLSSYYLPIYDYVYTSVGHNSAYKVVNKNNEILTVDSTHARTFSTGASPNGLVSMEDQGMITRQVDFTGNISIQNMIAYTESKWQVAFPLQYNGNDTTVGQFTAADIVGTYAGNNLMMSASYNYARPETFTVTACDDEHVYFQIGGTKYTAALTYGKDYAGQDITYITGDEIEGVIAKQGDTFEFSFFNKSTLQHTWGYQTEKGDASAATHDKTTVVTNEADVYTWTTTCSKCDFEETRVVDITAYKASVELAQAEVDNTAKYTEKSITELREYIIELDLTATSTLTQNDVDNYNTRLTTANKIKEGENDGVLVLNQYKLTFKVYKHSDNDEEGEDAYIGQHQYVLDYGTQIPLDVNSETFYASYVDGVPQGDPQSLPNEYSIYKWTRYSRGNTDKLESNNEKITVIVPGADVDYYVFINDNDPKQVANSSQVNMMTKYGKIADVNYIVNNNEENSSYTLGLGGKNCKLTIGDKTLTAHEYPFYSITDYVINGQKYSVDSIRDGDQTIVITEDTTIVPIYEVDEKYNIYLGENIVSSSGKSEMIADAEWNSVITLKANDADADKNTVWYVVSTNKDGTIVDGAVPVIAGYGTTYKFRVSQDCKIYRENTAEAPVPVIAVERVSYNNPREKSITAVAKYAVPEGYEMVQAGVIMKTSTSPLSPVSTKVSEYEGATKGKFAAENLLTLTDQFIIHVYASKEYNSIDVGAVGYLVYRDKNGVEHTVYSKTVQTCHYEKVTS